ncbi:sensor histidine kinase [Aquincola tertiaricarbonis]|uniref:sensor histidine kinase n=1 Tax=Aquincola tertiaricarbonis TaxID=391953 RepID=UPI0006987274|nr:ATP-binding protein [Aquincola tertiaricarbonis]
MALAATTLCPGWAAAQAAEAAQAAAPLWLLWAASPVGLAAAAAAGWLLARRQGERALRDARTELQLMRQTLDVWQWETDTEHRLVQWRPPCDAPAADWQPPAAECLWQRFDSPQQPGLVQAKLAQHGPLDDAVARPDGSRWWLRGQPRFGTDGLFAGHTGTARLLDDMLATQEDQAALQALLPALPGPVWICRPAADGLQVQRCNEAALRFGGPPGSTWEGLLAALPRDLATTVQALQPGQAAVHEDWQVQLLPAGPQDEGRLLMLLPLGLGASEPADTDPAAFSYTVSHDLRAPVRVVEGFTRIVKEDYGRLLDRVGNDHLDRVLGAAARMNAMIDALLGLAQLSSQPLARQPVNLTQLATYVVDDLRRQQPQRRAEVRIQPGLQAHGDPTLLRLVLENLLGNAWKYSGQREHTVIEFATDVQSGREAFVVRDNGAGFDMRFADRLFSVFQRLHSANDFPGTGVGLASVRRIVRRHGGDVWAESEPGQGACFYFTLAG